MRTHRARTVGSVLVVVGCIGLLAGSAQAQPQSNEQLLDEAQRLYDDLEYDRVLPITEAILARPNVPIEQQLDAYLLQGSAIAIIGNPVEAERSFRLLLRGRPSYELPASTPPRSSRCSRRCRLKSASSPISSPRSSANAP